jgi:glycosyltransferase involved in cell wall biosynthesis
MQTLKFHNPESSGLVSVIIPTRNGERFIGAALESIGRQSYRNWEVIVIEDGSQGETESIVRQFASRHPDNYVYYQRNAKSNGAAFTQNLAFTQASGQWVAFLDCDDRWLADHLESCIGELNENGSDIAYSAAIMCEDGTDHVLSAWGPTHGEITDFPMSLFGRSFVTPSATVVRRSVIGDVGNWNTDCRYCEDAEFFMRAA